MRHFCKHVTATQKMESGKVFGGCYRSAAPVHACAKKSEQVRKGGGGNGEGTVAPQDVLRLHAERTHGNARAMLA